MRKLVTATLALTTLLATVAAHAEQYPRGLSTDSRIRVVMYDPNNVVLIKARYGYQTDITFAPGETVQNVSIGDSLAWQAVPVSNNLFIKPVATSQTNMTVLTNTHSYNFLLDSTNLRVIPTYKLQFTYPDVDYSVGTGAGNTTFNPNNFNMEYSYTGNKEIAPVMAFDNGQFTYFKFKDNRKLPAIFIVDKDRKETLVNYHMQGDYLVVNTTAKQFTLRNGDYVTCVYNDKAIGDWHSVKRS